MRPRLLLVALASLATMAATASVPTASVPTASVPTASAPTANRVHAAFAGHWQGTLRYRDYRDSSRFETLPTLLDASLSADSSAVTLAFTYDDGPGKTVRELDLFDLDRAGRVVRWGTQAKGKARAQFAVDSLVGGAEGTPIRLVLSRDGEDDNRPARLRETITFAATELTVLKEVRFAVGAPWIFRHEYRLARRPAGS